jgi:LacI family transcriptional regulator
MPGKHKPLTLGDLAKVAGCSRSVVSAVLNGSKGNIRVSVELRERVLDIAKKLNYRPNHASQALALGRTMTLGVYIDPLYGGGLAGQYHAHILAGIEAAAVEAGYDVLLVNFAGRTTFAECIDKIGRSRIDGLLLLHAGRNDHLINAVLEASSNVVAIDSLDPPPTLQAVVYDHTLGVRQALEHLAELGHRRIGYFGPQTTRPVPHNLARIGAFLEVAAELGLETSGESVFSDHTHTGPRLPEPEATDRSVRAYQALPPHRRPTAAVVYNDRLALALLRALHRAGRSVPGDLSLVNFENTALCRATTPSLTCLDHPVHAMSRCAAERLIQIIETPPPDEAEPWHVVFPSTLVVRESTAPIAAGKESLL